MTVQELNNLCKEQEIDTPLLSNANFDFWEVYISNHDKLDNLFVKKFKSMHYFNESDFTSKTEELTDWLYTIESFLFANEKKYHEWYRVQLIEDADLSMTTNYDMTRTSTTSGINTGATTNGARNDVTNINIGSQNFSNLNKTTAFNSATEKTKSSDASAQGTRNDVTNYTVGQQTLTNVDSNNTTTTSHDVGNLGVQTGADILMTFKKALDSGVFSFYDRVFNDIAKEFLIWGD